MNNSKQRNVVLRVLKSTKTHPTAEWVYEESKQILPSISLGTVYRNLAQLVEKGEIIKVQGVFDKDRFDGNATRHPHLVCMHCDSVLDINVDDNLDKEILGLKSSCNIVDYNLVFNGICEKCLKKAETRI